MCGRFFSLQIKTLNERCVRVCVPTMKSNRTFLLCVSSLQKLPCEVSGGKQHVPHVQDCYSSEPSTAVYRVSEEPPQSAHTHKRTHTLTHSHFECHQLCSASKQTAEDQRAGGPFPFDFCSSAGNKNPLGVVRLLSFVDLHLAQKHLKPTPIHSSVFCTRVQKIHAHCTVSTINVLLNFDHLNMEG